MIFLKDETVETIYLRIKMILIFKLIFLNNGLPKGPFLVVLCHKRCTRFATSTPQHPPSFSHPHPHHSFHFFSLQSKIYFCSLNCFKKFRRHQVKSSFNSLSDRLCFPTIGYTVTTHKKSSTAVNLHTYTLRSQLMPLFPFL